MTRRKQGLTRRDGGRSIYWQTLGLYPSLVGCRKAVDPVARKDPRVALGGSPLGCSSKGQELRLLALVGFAALCRSGRLWWSCRGLRTGFLALTLLLEQTVMVQADAFEDGLAAYNRGDYAAALRFSRLAAEQGVARAQFNLGNMFSKGLGVPQDFVHAHMWFDLAAEQDFDDARENREIVAKHMTPDQIAEAQRLAREWMETHQQ